MAIGRPIEQTPNIADKVVTATATAGQTQFTVTGGYRINHLAVFRNGVRLVNGNDYTALDGVTITLMEDASNLDVLEFQVFDTFSVSDALLTNAASQTVNGDVIVNGTFTVGSGGIGTFVAATVDVGIVSSTTGITTVQSLQASSSTTTGALQVKGGVGIGKSLYVGGNVSVGGTLTYEDVTNVDSVGLVTAGKGVRITTGGLVVTAGVSTFAGITTVTNTAALHSKQLNVSAGSTFGGAVTANDTLTVGSHLYIPDSIMHVGDTDTRMRFPAADTFTVETAGTERVRVSAAGSFGIGIDTPTKLFNAVVGVGTTEVIRLSQPVDASVQQEFGIGWCSNNNHVWPGSQITSLEYDVSDPRRSLLFYTRGANSDTAPTERLKIDSSGGVKITGAGSTTLLSIYADENTVYNGAATDGQLTAGATLFIENDANANNTVNQIVMQSRTGYEYNRIVTTGGSGPEMAFCVNDAERLRIDANGRVGINTDNPTRLLHLCELDVQAAYLHMTNAGTGHTSGDGYSIQLATDGQVYYRARKSAGGTHRFYVGTSEKLRLTNEGRLRILNNNEDIDMDSDASGQLGLDGNGYNGAIALNAIGMQIYTNSASRGIVFGTNETERMRLVPAGDVGIGITNPDTTLHLATNSSPDQGQDYAALSLGSPAQPLRKVEIGARRTTADSDWDNVGIGFKVHTSTNHLVAPELKMVIDYNGYVGIGSSAPSYPLDVKHTSEGVVSFQSTKTTDEGVEMRLYHNSASPADGDQLGYIQFTGNDDALNPTIYNAIIGYSKDVTNGTEDGELRFYGRKASVFTQQMTLYGDSGELKIHNGNLSFGTAGTGIDFSAQTPTSATGATTTSELLDHYEEGTWTPVAADAASGGNTSSTTYTNNGKYTKIGRQITVTAKMLNIDTTGLTAGNDVYVRGLPYAAMSGVEAVGPSVVNANWSSNTTWINSSILENDSFVRFHESADNTSRDYLRWTEIADATGDIIFTLTYFTS